MDDFVKVVVLADGILHISLNRPEQLNSLNQAVLSRLSTILLDAKKDDSIKSILLTGEGKAFCAGADIYELAGLIGTEGMTFARHGQSVFNLFETLGKPSIALVHGYALGGGCELAMATTLRLAATNAIFGQPEIKLGVIPGFGGTQRLARLIGKGRALEICLTGRRFNAEEALSWGLVNEVVAPDQLITRALYILKELATYSKPAMRSIMEVINLGYDLPLHHALELEASHFGLCCNTLEKQEGIKNFLEKRKN